MFAYLEGTVAEKGLNELVLDVHGVGYSLTCSMTTLQQCPATGEKMKVYTYLAVREDGVDLFGFSSREEKRMFLKLTGVSGIGPKGALAILGSMPLSDLRLAILTGDANALSRAPGIGKKTAQRLVLELKDKLGVLPTVDGVIPPVVAAPATGNAEEAVRALTSLGFTAGEASQAVGQLDGSLPVEKLIHDALKALARR